MTAMPQIPTYDVPPLADVTGSLQMPSSMSPSYALPPSLSMPTPPSARPSPKLPTAIGGATLRTAAVAGDAAAEYEIGLRYVEGRGVPANPAEAVRWLELAAKQGLAMAQFRLAGFYEKGLGIKKDIETARRLYKAAAEQGNAKAMHNLAVLYAEGAAVKPDYRTAAQWFRLASDHGISDSQYNLAILYARGIGVDQNLVESYKWFALAADQGDQEAARKRDEVVKRLDPQSLATAKLAVQAFVPQPQPDAATAVKIPAGGWDAASSNSTEAVPAKPKRAVPVRLGSR
jgi:localization factor PodJL